MRWATFAAVLLCASACFNETSPTDTPPEVPAPSGPCYHYPSAQPVEDASLAFDASADAGDATMDATLDAAASVVDASPFDASPPETSYCEPPPSVCADLQWVAYFDDGRCTYDRCNFVTKYHFCPGGCVGGLCAQHHSSGGGGGTLAGPPPKW